MKTTKYILGMILSAAFIFTGCMKEDIDELRAQQAKNADRIAALEAWQTTVNSNIGTLQQLVTALQGNDYVTGVTPFTTPAPGGYRITFNKSGEATIWNGAQGETGATGHSPVIAVAEFPADSSVYYWTLDGAFIESGGQKIPTTGATPKVAIGDNYWYISADGSATGTAPGAGWTSTNVKATGDPGHSGPQGPQGTPGIQGDAIFAANGIDNTNADYVIFTLADGTTKITVPKYKTVGISFLPLAFLNGEMKNIEFTSTGAPTIIRIVDIPAGWKVTVDLIGKKFTITAPSTITSDNSGEATVFVGTGNQITAIYALPLSNTGVASNELGAVYYQNGVATGMVYIVNDGTSASGRVVSLDEPGSYLQWSDFDFQASVTNTSDGMANMQAIKMWMVGNGKNWTNFPAMNWVHNTKNGGIADYSESNATGVWYLPARDELEHLFCVYNDKPLETWVDWNDYPSWGSNDAAANTAFNAKLTIAGGAAFGGTFYWSSSEDGTGIHNIYFFNGGLVGSMPKSNDSGPRAVAKF